jgi:hypothetical protein
MWLPVTITWENGEVSGFSDDGGLKRTGQV